MYDTECMIKTSYKLLNIIYFISSQNLKVFKPINIQLKFLKADNGSIYFWDWLTGHNFQKIQSAAQPGSIDSEMGVFALGFDQSGSRLMTCEADKTVKIYKEDENAVIYLRLFCSIKFLLKYFNYFFLRPKKRIQ